MKGPLYSLSQLPWEVLDNQRRRKVVHGDLMSVTQYQFGEGGGFDHHIHPQEQITYVLRGEITFTVDAVEHPMGAGDLIVIPSQAPHSARAGSGGAEVISFVSPSRRDGSNISYVDPDTGDAK